MSVWIPLRSPHATDDARNAAINILYEKLETIERLLVALEKKEKKDEK